MRATILALLGVALWAAPATAGCTPFPTTPQTDRPGSPTATVHRQQEAFIRARLVERPYATIAIGDSIMGGWPETLLEGLWGGPALVAGRGGSTSLHWQDWLDRWNWSVQNPAVVHLSTGRNDITYGYCPGAIARSVLATIAKVKAKWPEARVVWQTMAPGGEYLRLKAYEIREANRLVVAQAANLGFEVLDVWTVVAAHCTGVQVCDLFLVGDKYRLGPVHFGLNGYEAFYNEAKVLP